MGAFGLRKPMKPVSPVDPPEDDLVVTILTRMGDWMILHRQACLWLAFLLVIVIPGGLPVNILIIAVCVYLVLWWLWRSLLREED